MRIEKLVLENWMPFGGRQVLDLPTGPIAVTATYVGNPLRSNWGGKTAFLEAIEWAIFGVHRKRYEDGVIHGQESETMVAIELTGDIKITRSRRRGKSTQLLLEVGGLALKQKDAQQRIDSILGFSAEDYRATVCFSQGDTSAIVDKTSGERRQIVGQWLELEAWLRVTTRIKNKARAAAKDITETRATLKALTSHVDGDGYLPEEENFTGDAPTDRKNSIEAAELKLDHTRHFIKVLELELEAVSEVEISRLDHSRFVGLKSKLAELKTSIQAKDPRALQTHLKVLTDEQSETNELLGIQREELRTSEKLTMVGFTGTCPIINGECPSAAHVNEQKEAFVERFETAKEAFETTNVEFHRNDTRVKSIRRDMTALERLRADYRNTHAEMKRLAPSAEAYLEFDDTSKLGDEAVAAMQQKLQTHRRTERESIATITRLQGRISRIQNAEAQAHRVRCDLEELESTAAITAVALRCVGPSGVPAKIAEASLVHLEDRSNALLEGSGLSFRFAWDRETKKLTPACFECGYTYRGVKDKSCPACSHPRGMKRADELEILVDDGSGELEDVKAKSGGAKVMIGSAIRLGAGLMLRELRGSPAAWAQVDEPFGPLDAENRATLAQTFAGMLGAVGLEQAFVVSHDAALLDALPSRIEIVRDGKTSTATVR